MTRDTLYAIISGTLFGLAVTGIIFLLNAYAIL